MIRTVEAIRQLGARCVSEIARVSPAPSRPVAKQIRRLRRSPSDAPVSSDPKTRRLHRSVGCDAARNQSLAVKRSGVGSCWLDRSACCAGGVTWLTWALALGATLRPYRDRIQAQLSKLIALSIPPMTVSTFRQPSIQFANLSPSAYLWRESSRY